MFSSLTSFTFFEPPSLEDACRSLAQAGPDAQIVAGGCDLVPSIRRRTVAPSALVSIARIPAIDGVSFDPAGLRILPMACLRAVERCEPVRREFTALYEGVHSIASVQVKATGTLVGNVCVATPASDISPPLMVLGGVLHLLAPGGRRTIPVGDLFAGTKKTGLAPGEIAREIQIAPLPPRTGSAFAKLTRTAADCAKINVAARVTLDGDRASDVRIALGSVAATPVRAPAAERVLADTSLEDDRIAEAARVAAADTRPITDLRSTAAYRRQALEVLLRRVVAAARDRARGEAQ